MLLFWARTRWAVDAYWRITSLLISTIIGCSLAALPLMTSLNSFAHMEQPPSRLGFEDVNDTFCSEVVASRVILIPKLAFGSLNSSWAGLSLIPAAGIYCKSYPFPLSCQQWFSWGWWRHWCNKWSSCVLFFSRMQGFYSTSFGTWPSRWTNWQANVSSTSRCLLSKNSSGQKETVFGLSCQFKGLYQVAYARSNWEAFGLSQL